MDGMLPPALPVVVGVDGQNGPLMDLASDGVASRDSLAHPEGLRQVRWRLIAQSHLLVLCSHSLPVRFQLGPFLQA